jgi:transcription termination factor Rho
MSVGSDALTRSKLEQKDRAELAAIVEAMGGRATTRARKAELVDMVLTLAGHGEETGDGGGGDTGGEFLAAPAPVPSTADPEPPRAQLSFDAEPKAEWEMDLEADGDLAPDAGPAGGAGAVQPAEPAPPVPDEHDDEPGGQVADREAAVAPAPSGGQAANGQHAPSGHGAQPGTQPEGGRDDGEGGGRRRRRRGRDRDRSPDQAGPAGGGGPRPDQQGSQRNPATGGTAEAEPTYSGEPVAVAGYLDLRDEGYGFLRLRGFLPSKEDVYVSVKQVRQFGLRRGDFVKGASRPASRNEKNPALLRIDAVNDDDPEAARSRPRFEDLTPLFPDTRLHLEMADDPANMTARIIDLISPIGKGQRGLIVSPPKAGKTTIMKQIARSIEVNNPETHLIVLLVDERPEEVTDMKRWLQRGEVAASTFDRPAEEHTQVAELTLERAKRTVEGGKDVVIILDGITRLARAYNLAAPATGRVMSGGVDSGALYPPKKFFGAARNTEEGGSLTILATALVETGSRMDEVIFEEFKGTGNMELRLDRRLAERRIYPAIDVHASSTRHEELLFDGHQLAMVWKLRRVLAGLSGGEGGSAAAGLELLIDRMKTFRSNGAFLDEIARA